MASPQLSELVANLLKTPRGLLAVGAALGSIVVFVYVFLLKGDGKSSSSGRRAKAASSKRNKSTSKQQVSSSSPAPKKSSPKPAAASSKAPVAAESSSNKKESSAKKSASSDSKPKAQSKSVAGKQADKKSNAAKSSPAKKGASQAAAAAAAPSKGGKQPSNKRPSVSTADKDDGEWIKVASKKKTRSSAKPANKPRMHHQEEELIEMPGNKRQGYECPKCKNNYSTAYSMYRHMRKVHNCEVNRCVTLYCPIENCNQSYDRYNALDTHLTHVHYLDIRKETLNFQKVDDFELWLREVMTSSKTKYIKRSCNDVYRYYRCHRSGLPKTSTDKINTMKSSVKIGRHCPSRIIAKMTEGQVQVEFVPTHIGHDCEVSKIPLSPEKRLDMRSKLSASATSSDPQGVGANTTATTTNSNGAPATSNSTENGQQIATHQAQQVTPIQTDTPLMATLTPMRPIGHTVTTTTTTSNHLIPQLQQPQPPQSQQQPNRNIMLINSLNTRRRELTSKFEELMLSISSEKHASIVRAQLEVCFALIKD